MNGFASCVVGLVASVLPLAAQAAIEVGLPLPLAELVAACLREQLAGVTVAVAEPGGLRAVPGSVVLADAFVLQRLARERSLAVLPESIDGRRTANGAFVLPWSLGYAVVGVPFGSEPDWTWERLALAGELDQRLLLLPPDRDAGPFVASMQEGMRHGRGLEPVLGLWTTLDARLLRYAESYDEVAKALRDEGGQGMAAVLPQPLLANARGDLASRRLPCAVPLGLAVIAGGDASDPAALVARICSTVVRTAVRDRVGLLDPAADDAEPTAETVGPALSHFEQRIRGQGRRVERVADVLDYVFLLLLGVVLCVFWIRSRKETPT